MPSERPRCEVLVIESPSLADLAREARVGLLLVEQLRLCALRVHRELCAERDAFMDHLADPGLGEVPIVHLVCHGDQRGIRFTDGRDMCWLELQCGLIEHCRDRIVVLSSCESAFLQTTQEDLASHLMTTSRGYKRPPRVVLTMLLEVALPDALLGWGLFYRRLFERLGDRSVREATARDVYEALVPVRDAGLPKVCCAFWYERYQRYVNVSPWWEVTETRRALDAMEAGEPVP